MREPGYLDQLHGEVGRFEEVVEAGRGTRGWDVDVWCDRILVAARAVLARPGLGRDPARLARVTHLLMTDLPETLTREGRPAEPDPVRRRIALAAELAAIETRLRREL